MFERLPLHFVLRQCQIFFVPPRIGDQVSCTCETCNVGVVGFNAMHLDMTLTHSVTHGVEPFLRRRQLCSYLDMARKE
jgi:hypothetical protein